MQTEQLNHSVTLLHIENSAASATISLFGAQLLSYIPARDRKQRLYLSKSAVMDGSKPIRGGIPLCWPWFGRHPNPALPNHGFMRNTIWSVIDIEETDELSVLLLEPGIIQGPGWSETAELQLRISIGAELTLELITTNTGALAFPLSCAFHSYFAVSDVRKLVLAGITGDYLDNNNDLAECRTPDSYKITGATDHIHLQAAASVSLREGKRSITLSSAGHDSLVVWNPWQQACAELEDMDDEDYLHMLCVETALTQGMLLLPGESHCLRMSID